MGGRRGVGDAHVPDDPARAPTASFREVFMLRSPRGGSMRRSTLKK